MDTKPAAIKSTHAGRNRRLSQNAALVTFGALETHSALTADISELYRFAVLLTGRHDAAKDVLLDTLAGVQGELTQFRNDRHRTSWFVGQVRERALRRQSAPEGEDFASRFAALPEPERTALALFYLDFLPVRDIAHLLKMTLEILSEHLRQGRAHLRELLERNPDQPTETSAP